MNDAMLISYDPFAMESRISILTNGHQEQLSVCSEMNELAAKMIGLCYSYNIYDIKMHAPFAVSCEFRRLVEDCEKNQYAENKITVEGI